MLLAMSVGKGTRTSPHEERNAGVMCDGLMDLKCCYGELNMGKNGKSPKSPIFNFLINGRILFSVLDGENKKVRGRNTYGGPPHHVSDP
eukprot:COSAG04_NODE_10472_length_774_cov_3.592593_1_plen_89_part_00